jgi:heme oxygenase (biliverdin-producing, ferredoxin)
MMLAAPAVRAHASVRASTRPSRSHRARALTVVAAHGHGHGASMGAQKGFVEEMRRVAMALHTREQAPKEGKKTTDDAKKEQQPVARWAPTPEGYLAFLIESRAVYRAMEGVVGDDANASTLDKDIAYMCERFGLKEYEATGAGKEYAEFLTALAKTSPPEFICHFYNVYFAHSAGGRMIGRKVSEMILDGKALEFYEWREHGGLDESLMRVRGLLNDVSEAWSREEKDRCLEETGKSFQLSGQLLRLIA